MARSKSPAQALLEDVVAAAVTAPLKAAGFRRGGRNYHRRRGEAVQVVNVQVSHAATWTETAFCVNAGVAFDAVCRLAGVSVLERPQEYECDDRGTRGRLEQLLPAAPPSWTLRAGEDAAGVAAQLADLVGQLVAEFDRIDGVAAYRAHRWFDRVRPVPSNAQVLYLLGDREGACRELEGVAAQFAGHPDAGRADWWAGRLGLADLPPRPA